MIVVIDGYNMLGQIFSGIKGKMNSQKKYLIQQLAAYKKCKSNVAITLIIVFDAGPLTHATRDIYQGVIVMHSGQKSSADEWIIEYIQKNKNQEIVVVTKDREIIDSCKYNNVQNIDGQDFYQLIKSALIQTPCSPEIEKNLKDHKTLKYEPTNFYREDNNGLVSKISQQELDMLMHEGSLFTQEKDESVEDKKNQRPQKTLSKKEKKLYHTFKKLSKI